VDLFQLQVNTLRRYKRHYKLQTRPGLNKAQLAETVSRHFRNIPVNEKETLTYFIYMQQQTWTPLSAAAASSPSLPTVGPEPLPSSQDVKQNWRKCGGRMSSLPLVLLNLDLVSCCH
ncbi:Histone deacetylase complex subunit sap30l, partial [Ilyodon furcidens]